MSGISYFLCGWREGVSFVRTKREPSAHASKKSECVIAADWNMEPRQLGSTGFLGLVGGTIFDVSGRPWSMLLWAYH